MRYVKTVLAACITFPLAFASTSARAGLYSDEMARCLVKTTTPADRTVLARWVFLAIALHPEVKPFLSVSDAERNELNRAFAKLFEVLLTESCRSQAQEAIKYEGPSAFEASFQILGQVASRELFSHPDVARSMADVMKHLDKQKLEAVLGIPQK